MFRQASDKAKFPRLTEAPYRLIKKVCTDLIGASKRRESTGTTFVIKRYGASVNLGNLALSDLMSVQSLRFGLRSDTLLDVQESL